MPFDKNAENLIANLRGFPENKSRSIKRAAVPIDSVLEVILERYRINQPRVEDTIMSKWKEIVGERTAHRCSPQRIVQEKKLLVFAANSTVRSELKFNERNILKKLKSLPGCDRIEAIVFHTG